MMKATLCKMIAKVVNLDFILLYRPSIYYIVEEFVFISLSLFDYAL